MEKREIDLSVSCYEKVKDVKYDVVILPWGATEPHNLHFSFFRYVKYPFYLPQMCKK